MDARLFDALTRLLAHRPSRRAILPALGALLAEPLAAGAKKKKGKKKKVTLCLNGQDITASKNKKKKLKKLRKKGATRGACPLSPPPPVCTPRCSGTTCGGDDSCGGTCGCSAGAVCHLGVCKPCDIACPPGRAGCGDELQALLNNRETVIACPGRYARIFTIS